MGFFDFFKSDDEKRADQQKEELTWAKGVQSRALSEGGAGAKESDLKALMSSAHAAANAVRGKKDPEQIQQIIASAWTQQVERIEPPPGVAEAIYFKIVAPAVPPKLKNEIANGVFEGLYNHDEEATVDSVPVTPDKPAPVKATAKPTTKPRPTKRPNMDHDGEGSVGD